MLGSQQNSVCQMKRIVEERCFEMLHSIILSSHFLLCSALTLAFTLDISHFYIPQTTCHFVYIVVFYDFIFTGTFCQ